MSRERPSGRLVLTPRDAALLGSLAEYRCLTVSQLERLHFPSAQTARRRLRLLGQAGLLRLSEVATIPERVVALTGAGVEALRERSGTAAEPPNGRPLHPLFLAHHLAVAEFRLRLTAACGRRADLRLAGFLPEYLTRPSRTGQPLRYLRDEVPPAGGERALAHTPDGVFGLERGGEVALFFLEVDRGTEVLGQPEHGVEKIVRFYLRYLLSGRFQRYQADFGAAAEFRGFRALLVTTSEERLAHIRQRCGRIPCEPPSAKRFLWLAPSSVLTDGDPLACQWRSIDPTDASHYHLAPAS